MCAIYEFSMALKRAEAALNATAESQQKLADGLAKLAVKRTELPYEVKAEMAVVVEDAILSALYLPRLSY